MLFAQHLHHRGQGFGSAPVAKEIKAKITMGETLKVEIVS
jgi:hypothetical protein